MISWLFEIDALKFSTKAVTYSGSSYSARIITDSFSGITMRWDISGNGLISPNDLTFDVSDPDGTYTAATFDGKDCTVRLIIDAVEIRVFKFVIDRVVSHYGKHTCFCMDFLQKHLAGSYPNTPNPKEVWSSDDNDGEGSDTYCIPVILGIAYIPVRSVNTGTFRFYILGESGPVYTVNEVRSPRDWPNTSEWTSALYDMDGYVNSGWQLLQPIIADSDGDGIADAPGLWRSGDTFYDMLCRYSRADTASLTSPADWVEYVLKDFGVPIGDINLTTFSTAAALYTSQSIAFEGGGWWVKESREKVLSNLLSQVDSFIKCTDQVELHQFSATSKETITNVLELSFSPSAVSKSENDSGRVHWPEATDKPSDVLFGKAVVETNSGTGATTDSISSEILQCRFLSGQSINAQKAGMLYFQKKFEQSQRVNFSTTLTMLTNAGTLTPGEVVTINNTLYGGENDIVITEMAIGHDLRVNFSGVVLNHLEDWTDLTPSAKSIITDASQGFQLATTDYTGALSTEWGNIIDIPSRFLDTASLGLNVTSDYLGYFNGTAFLSYIDSSGNFLLGEPVLSTGLAWNQSTGVLTVSGDIVVKNATTVRTALNVANGADVTQTALTAGADIANTVVSGTTLISGGYIRSNFITASNITTGTLNATNVSVTNLDATNINTGSMSGIRITNGTIAAGKMNVTTLSAIAANIGTVTAGILQSSNWGASNGMQIDLSNSTITVRGTDALTVSSTGSVLVGGSLSVTGYQYVTYPAALIYRAGTTEYGRWYIDNIDEILLLTASEPLHIRSTSNITIKTPALVRDSAVTTTLGTSSMRWGKTWVTELSATVSGAIDAVNGTSGTKAGVVGATSNTSNEWGFYTTAKCNADGGYYPFTGAHFGFTKQVLAPGDIVCADGAWLTGVNDAFLYVSLSTTLQCPRVAGVVSYSGRIQDGEEIRQQFECNPKLFDKTVKVDGKAEYTLREDQKEDAEKPIKGVLPTKFEALLKEEYGYAGINALGEGGINVCDENGNIEIGDYICTSNIPGKGMRQQDDVLHNYTVAKALEPVDWSEEASNIKMIACTYHCG